MGTKRDDDHESLIPKHGGYHNLKTFKLAELIYDLTVLFCERYVDRFSRTRDQMTQAARSGVQNIVEGSQASGTSKKTELKLTSVARASLEELRRDYEDFLRQRGLEQYAPKNSALERFKALRCSILAEVRDWVREEHERARTGTDSHGPARTDTDKHGLTRTGTDLHGPARTGTDSHGPARTGTDEHGPARTDGADHNGRFVAVCTSRLPSHAELAANAALSLLNVCCHLLDNQLEAQGEDFKKNGGFTERLYQVRKPYRDGPRPWDIDERNGQGERLCWEHEQ